MLYANAIVGRTGLCNMLCPWARAIIWARDNNAEMLAPRWTNFLRIGPLVRRERSMRWYLNEFTNDGYVKGARRFLALCGRHFPEEERDMVASEASRHRVIDFSGMKGFIAPLMKEQGFLKAELFRIVNPVIVKRVEEASQENFIGVHIRRGDFKGIGLAINDGWYLRAIHEARRMAGDLRVKVFSDEAPKELQGVLSRVDNAVLMPKAPAVQDLLMLSRSRILIGTSRSSFSYWAAFLGQMQCIWHIRNAPGSWRIDNVKPIVLQ